MRGISLYHPSLTVDQTVTINSMHIMCSMRIHLINGCILHFLLNKNFVENLIFIFLFSVLLGKHIPLFLGIRIAWHDNVALCDIYL